MNALSARTHTRTEAYKATGGRDKLGMSVRNSWLVYFNLYIRKARLYYIIYTRLFFRGFESQQPR